MKKRFKVTNFKHNLLLIYMKIDSQNCFFKINFQVLSIFILYLVALFYGPSLVNLFYLLMSILFIYQLYTKKISLKFNLMEFYNTNYLLFVSNL